MYYMCKTLTCIIAPFGDTCKNCHEIVSSYEQYERSDVPVSSDSQKHQLAERTGDLQRRSNAFGCYTAKTIACVFTFFTKCKAYSCDRYDKREVNDQPELLAVDLDLSTGPAKRGDMADRFKTFFDFAKCLATLATHCDAFHAEYGQSASER